MLPPIGFTTIFIIIMSIILRFHLLFHSLYQPQSINPPEFRPGPSPLSNNLTKSWMTKNYVAFHWTTLVSMNNPWTYTKTTKH